MKVVVKYLALHRELVDKSEETCQLSNKSIIQDLWNQLVSLHPHLAEVLDDTTISLNGMLADFNSRLKEGDTVTLFPVVSGG